MNDAANNRCVSSLITNVVCSRSVDSVFVPALKIFFIMANITMFINVDIRDGVVVVDYFTDGIIKVFVDHIFYFVD